MLKIYIVYKVDDPLNYRYYLYFWVWKRVEIFLANNNGYSYRYNYFELEENDPLRRTINENIK